MLSNFCNLFEDWVRLDFTLQWRHNGHNGVSNLQPHYCLLNRSFGHRLKKHQSSTSLAFVWGIHRWPVNSLHKWPVTQKMFPFDDVIMIYGCSIFKWGAVTCRNALWPSNTIWQNKWSTLAQVMVCCLTTPSHYMNQCLLLISEGLWHWTENNFTASTEATILYHKLNYMFKIFPYQRGAKEDTRVVVPVVATRVTCPIQWLSGRLWYLQYEDIGDTVFPS